jgi:hypothetical protein
MQQSASPALLFPWYGEGESALEICHKKGAVVRHRKHPLRAAAASTFFARPLSTTLLLLSAYRRGDSASGPRDQTHTPLRDLNLGLYSRFIFIPRGDYNNPHMRTQTIFREALFLPFAAISWIPLGLSPRNFTREQCVPQSVCVCTCGCDLMGTFFFLFVACEQILLTSSCHYVGTLRSRMNETLIKQRAMIVFVVQKVRDASYATHREPPHYSNHMRVRKTNFFNAFNIHLKVLSEWGEAAAHTFSYRHCPHMLFQT